MPRTRSVNCLKQIWMEKIHDYPISILTLEEFQTSINFFINNIYLVKVQIIENIKK